MLRIMVLAEEEIPKADLLRFDFKMFNDWNDGLPSSLISGKLAMGDFDSRKNFILIHYLKGKTLRSAITTHLNECDEPR
jgi:hypothetical protein